MRGSTLPQVKRGVLCYPSSSSKAEQEDLNSGGTCITQTAAKKMTLKLSSASKEDHLTMTDSLITGTDPLSDLNTPDINFEDFNFKNKAVQSYNSGNMEAESSLAAFEPVVNADFSNDSSLTDAPTTVSDCYTLFDMSPASRDVLQADQHEPRTNSQAFVGDAGGGDGGAMYKDCIPTTTSLEPSYRLPKDYNPMATSLEPSYRLPQSSNDSNTLVNNGLGAMAFGQFELMEMAADPYNNPPYSGTVALKQPEFMESSAPYNSPAQLSISDDDFIIPHNILEEIENLFPAEHLIVPNPGPVNDFNSTELDMYIGTQDILLTSLEASGLVKDLQAFNLESDAKNNSSRVLEVESEMRIQFDVFMEQESMAIIQPLNSIPSLNLNDDIQPLNSIPSLSPNVLVQPLNSIPSLSPNVLAQPLNSIPSLSPNVLVHPVNSIPSLSPNVLVQPLNYIPSLSPNVLVQPLNAIPNQTVHPVNCKPSPSTKAIVHPVNSTLAPTVEFSIDQSTLVTPIASTSGTFPKTPSKQLKSHQEAQTPVVKHVVPSLKGSKRQRHTGSKDISSAGAKRLKRTAKKPLRFREDIAESELNNSAGPERLWGDEAEGLDVKNEDEYQLDTGVCRENRDCNNTGRNNLTKEQKYHRIRSSNNEASKRCRQKRKTTNKEMKEELASLQEKNGALIRKHQALKQVKDKFQVFVNDYFRKRLSSSTR